MANFPQYQYQPQQMGCGQPMQTMYQQYQQPMQAPQAQMQQEQFFCRPVASADEARGIPVDFSGKPMILPHLSAGRIYVKMFDQGSGSAIFREFRMTEPETQTPQETFATMREVEQIKQTMASMQEELQQLKSGGKRKQKQEEVTDEV